MGEYHENHRITQMYSRIICHRRGFCNDLPQWLVATKLTHKACMASLNAISPARMMKKRSASEGEGGNPPEKSTIRCIMSEVVKVATSRA